MRTFQVLAASAVLAALAGCSDGPKFAKVSGIVTLDGKPYAKAVITFQPLGGPNNPNPGRGSSAVTDENGRYELTSDENGGAVIGKHLVRIATVGDNMSVADPNTGSADGAPPPGKQFDPIPAEWNALSDKEFDVPAGGTDKANFDIVPKKK